jgi:hypothetical protein
MASRGTDTRPVERSFGKARLEDARTFRLQAGLTTEHIPSPTARKAAASSAVLAAIAAADAACAVALGVVWKGEHAQAHTLLEQVTGGAEAAKELKRIVASKTQSHYLERPVTEVALTKALRQADAVVAFAEKTLRPR